MTKKSLQTTLLAGAVLLAFALTIGAALPHRALAEEGKEPRLISVNGEAELQVKPDMATLRFGVENQAATAQEAQTYNAGVMTKVINALSSLGIPKADIQTSNFSLYPVYEWVTDSGKEGRQVLSGYRCNNTVVTRIKNLDLIGKAIDAATGAGSNSIGGISFGLQDPKPQQDALLALAVKNAKGKAEIMARAAEVTIKGVHSISDGYTSVDSNEAISWARADMASTPVEPGSVTVRATVHVQYEF